MRVILSSKNIQLTAGLKIFIQRHLSKFQKFTHSGLSSLTILLDLNRHRKKKGDDAVVEIIGKIHEKPIVIRERGKTFYVAFFQAVTVLKEKLVRDQTRARRLAKRHVRIE